MLHINVNKVNKEQLLSRTVVCIAKIFIWNAIFYGRAIRKKRSFIFRDMTDRKKKRMAKFL